MGRWESEAGTWDRAGEVAKGRLGDVWEMLQQVYTAPKRAWDGDPTAHDSALDLASILTLGPAAARLPFSPRGGYNRNTTNTGTGDLEAGYWDNFDPDGTKTLDQKIAVIHEKYKSDNPDELLFVGNAPDDYINAELKKINDAYWKDKDVVDVEDLNVDEPFDLDKLVNEFEGIDHSEAANAAATKKFGDEFTAADQKILDDLGLDKIDDQTPMEPNAPKETFYNPPREPLLHRPRPDERPSMIAQGERLNPDHHGYYSTDEVWDAIEKFNDGGVVSPAQRRAMDEMLENTNTKLLEERYKAEGWKLDEDSRIERAGKMGVPTEKVGMEPDTYNQFGEITYRGDGQGRRWSRMQGDYHRDYKPNRLDKKTATYNSTSSKFAGNWGPDPYAVESLVTRNKFSENFDWTKPEHLERVRAQAKKELGEGEDYDLFNKKLQEIIDNPHSANWVQVEKMTGPKYTGYGDASDQRDGYLMRLTARAGFPGHLVTENSWGKSSLGKSFDDIVYDQRNMEPHTSKDAVNVGTYDPARLRRTTARFDPRLALVRNLSAGVGGVAILDYLEEVDPNGAAGLREAYEAGVLSDKSIAKYGDALREK